MDRTGAPANWAHRANATASTVPVACAWHRWSAPLVVTKVPSIGYVVPVSGPRPEQPMTTLFAGHAAVDRESSPDTCGPCTVDDAATREVWRQLVVIEGATAGANDVH